MNRNILVLKGVEVLISHERDDANHMRWHARGALHLDHSCEFICELGECLHQGVMDKVYLSHVGIVVLMSKTYSTI